MTGLQEPFLDQAVRADEQSIARERRQRLVRRITVTGRTKGERLPPALARCFEAVYHRECGPPHIPNAVRRRQRRNMQQQAGSAVLRSEWDKTRWTTGIAHRFPSAGSRPGTVDFSALFTISWASFKIPSLFFFQH
jgi:hypothetical protein